MRVCMCMLICKRVHVLCVTVCTVCMVCMVCMGWLCVWLRTCVLGFVVGGHVVARVCVFSY